MYARDRTRVNMGLVNRHRVSPGRSLARSLGLSLYQDAHIWASLPRSMCVKLYARTCGYVYRYRALIVVAWSRAGSVSPVSCEPDKGQTGGSRREGCRTANSHLYPCIDRNGVVSFSLVCLRRSPCCLSSAYATVEGLKDSFYGTK